MPFRSALVRIIPSGRRVVKGVAGLPRRRGGLSPPATPTEKAASVHGSPLSVSGFTSCRPAQQSCRPRPQSSGGTRSCLPGCPCPRRSRSSCLPDRRSSAADRWKQSILRLELGRRFGRGFRSVPASGVTRNKGTTQQADRQNSSQNLCKFHNRPPNRIYDTVIIQHRAEFVNRTARLFPF